MGGALRSVAASVVVVTLTAVLTAASTCTAPAAAAPLAGTTFDINGYIVGTWRNVDNGHLYRISGSGTRFERRAGSSWQTAEGCPVNAGDLFDSYTAKQTTGGYLNGGGYVGPWRQLKKDEKGACTWTTIQPGQQGYYDATTGFVPIKGTTNRENPSGQYLNWFCAYTGPYTQCGSLSRVGAGFVQPGAAAPQKPATTAPADIATTTAYRVFLGLDDAPSAACSTTRSRRVQAMTAAVDGAAGVTGKVEIQGEGLVGDIPGPTSLVQLLTLLGKDDIPQDLTRNVYARATRRPRGATTLEGALRARILAAPAPLEPAGLLRAALQVTGGSYPLAVLTAHNLLKGVTKTGRNDIAQWATAGVKIRPGLLRDLEQQSAVAAKLVNLRCSPAASADKLGMWYHAFAVLTAAALITPDSGALVAIGEHGMKTTKTVLTKLREIVGYALPASVRSWIPEGFFAGEGGLDPEKAAFDGAVAAAAIVLADVSRFSG